METIERNLQEIGRSLFVSLPKSWTNLFQLKKGSKVKMTIKENGNLIISNEYEKKARSKELEIDYDKYFKRMFFREYFKGYERITINITRQITTEERKNIYEFLKRFMSVQIIEENEKKIVIKSFRIEELTIDECIKRLYFLSLGMLEEITENNDKTMIKEMRDNMTRFYYLLVMQIRRYLEEGKFASENQISLIRAMDYRMVSEKMQRIGEIASNIDKTNKNEKNLLKNIKGLYSKTSLAFIHEKFDKVSDIQDNLEKISRSIPKNTNQEILSILRKTKEISSMIR